MDRNSLKSNSGSFFRKLATSRMASAAMTPHSAPDRSAYRETTFSGNLAATLSSANLLKVDAPSGRTVPYRDGAQVSQRLDCPGAERTWSGRRKPAHDAGATTLKGIAARAFRLRPLIEPARRQVAECSVE